MAIAGNDTGKGIVGAESGKGIVGSNAGKGIVGDTTGKGIVEQNNTDNIFMHAPYAVIFKPSDVGGNRTRTGASYSATKKVFDEAVKNIQNQSLTEAVDTLVLQNTPQIRVNSAGNGLVLSGTKDALDSDMGNELQKYLNDTFKYSDLKSKNISDAINQLNKDIRDQVEERVVSQAFGADYNDYKEYKLTMQQFQGTNPLTSTAAVPGYTKDGKKIKATDDGKKTLAEWLKYYQENYSAKERAELYNRSREAIAEGNKDFALWTPFLVMSGGKIKDLQADPVYGFSAGDRVLAGAEALLNEGSARLIEGANQTAFDIGSWIANAQGFARRDNLKNRAKRVLKTGSDITSKDIPWISEEAYNEKINSIKDKSVRALGKADKNFLAAALGDYSNSEIDDAVRNSSTVEDVLKYTSYNRYIDSRDNLSTVEKYDQEREKIKEKGAAGRKWLQEDVDAAALYAPIETTIGSFAGTMMRMWAEAGLISAATGGLVNPAGISDALAEKFMSMLSPTGNTLKALQTPVGSFLLSVAAEVPEDLVQTVIDDVITGRAGDVEQLAPTGDIGKDMAKLGESFAQNLAFRLVFTPIHAGANSLRQWRAAKKAAKAAGIPDNVISDEYFIRNQQAREAADAGNIVDVTKNSATVRNPDGTEQVIDNVSMLHFGTDEELQKRYPVYAEMLRKKGLIDEDIDVETAKMYDDPDVMAERLTDRTKLPTQEEINDGVPIKKYFEDYDIKRIDDPDVTNKIIDDNIPQKVQFGYYGESGDIIKGWQGREVMAGAALRNPELRNAGLNKAYDVYYNKLFPNDKKLSFEEWVNTPITLTRRFRAEEGVGSDNANVLGYSMRKEGLAEDTYGPETDTITIEPKYTTGLLMGADDAGFAEEGEIFVPTALIESHPKYMTVEDIVGVKNTEGDASIEAAPSSASYKWESPDVTKTYSNEKEVFADMPTGKNMTETRQWMKNAEAFYMGRYMEQTMPEFTKAYPTVDEQQQFVRNMDYLFDLQKTDKETIDVQTVKPVSEEPAVQEFSKEDILSEGKRLSEFSVALYQDVRDLNSIRNSWSDNYEDFYESIKADTARDEDFARRLLSFERGKDSVSKDYLWDKLRDSARNADTLDAFYDSSRGIIDSELEKIEGVRRGARPDKNVLATTDDYRLNKPSKKFIPSDERKAIYDKYMDQNAKTGWFIYAQPGSKKAVADSIKANPELHNAMLSEMYELSGSKLPYGEWLDTPMELHRVQIYDLPGEEDDFLSFSMNEDWGDHWRSEYTDAGIYYGDVPGDDTSLTIKPRDTFGAHIVADNEVQNTEVLVPREAYMNAWENSDTAAKRSLENDAELERLMAEGDAAEPGTAEVDSAGYRTGIVESDRPWTEPSNEGFYKFTAENINRPSRDAGDIGIEQTLVTPGGPIDTLNAAIRSGEVEVKNGKVDEKALRDAIEEGYDEWVFVKNFYDDPDASTEYDITDVAEQLGLKYADEKSAEEAVKNFVIDEAVKKFYEGNTTAKNNIILYRIVSSDGNEVATAIGGEKPKQGDIDWLKKESGDYVDNGVGFVTMDPDAVLENKKLAGSGDRYILRMHIAEGTPMFTFDNRVVTGGSDIMLGDTYRMSRGDRAGGEFALAPTKGKFVDSGDVDANGNKVIDVYIGQDVPSSEKTITASETPDELEVSGSALGKTYENEGIVYTVNADDVRFYQKFVEPMMTSLREAGAAGVGATPSTTIGYLPHSDYDPTILTAEDSMQQGVLWREYKGTSTTDDNGNFSTGWLNPDLTARYKTFVDNMLWDSLGDQVVVAKYMEEFNADGLDVAANTVEKMVGGRKRLAHLVSESDSVKAVVKNLLGDGELPTEAQLEKAAKDLGSTDIVHDLYRPVYGEAKGLYQVKSAISVKTMAKADWMRSLATGDGTLYDNGGAMIVNGAADAKFLAKRITDAIDNGEKLDVHQMFVEYLMQNQRRTAKGAGYIADKWMDKIAQRANNGGISRRALTAELSNLIYGEGANRLFRFIGRMDTSQLTSANKQALDSLLFRHSALSKVKNTSGISANINKWTNRLISARMKSLFWLNYKNGVLQASECIRLFTEFKFGDALSTINRLASDADFRARVDEWVDMLVPERFVKSDSEAATGAMKIIADNSSVKNGELTVNKMSDADMKSLGEKFNEFANQPVELGETMKNRVMMAGILQEAERKGLTGNELFNYVNQRFERIGLAANEMGRLNASDNPLFRLGANLKTFQIRQFRMFLNNIHDMNGTGEAATYIIKNLGWKAGLALIMGKLGYSTAATLGIDPFDLMDDDYTGVDEENYTGLDYAMASPVAKLFLSGGFTGYINDAYWAARKAYEDSASVTKQTEEKVSDSFWPGMKMPNMSFDNVFNAFSGFIPGFTAGKRVYQMNELMETGWATSATGNKMYQAPDNPLDVATGYLFGRSNTPNARAYYQTPDYLEGLMSGGLAGLGQQLGRELGGYRQFDPIDTQNYSDWFNGTAADEQQWNSGYYYFRNKMDDLQKEYQNSLSGFTTDKDETQLSESFNKRMAEIEEQLNKFTAAYEAKHPEGIDARKMRNLTTILNLYQPVMGDTDEERKQRELEANSDALYRYTQAGLPAVTSYKRNDEGEVEPVYSPQLRSALQGEYGLPQEAATQIRQLYNDKWKDLGKQYRDRLFSTKGTKNKQAIQKEYINIVRQDLDPIVRLYGNNIWGNEDVENIIDDVFNSMIPKYGQSAKSYLKGVYKDYTGQIRYNERGNETLTQINQLLDQGKTAQAKALARTLRQRVQENKTSLTRAELERLQKILND